MRHMNCGLIELKFAQGDDSANAMTFNGYGAVFGNVDAYGDVIEPGAFSQFLSEVRAGNQQWPAMLLQHGGYGMTAEDLMPVGIFTDLAEDGKGLKFEGKLADIQRARDAYALMKMQPRPAIDGMSIGYIAKDWEPRSKPEDPRRRIKRIDVVEISLVTFPANAQARVADVKSSDLPEREFERMLTRDAGFTRSEARLIINEGFKSYLAKRDAGEEDYTELASMLQKNIEKLRA